MPVARRPISQLLPDTRYRYGERGVEPRTAHAQQSRQWRRDVALAGWRSIESRLLAALAAGRSLSEACESVGTTPAAVHGRRRWDPGWGERLDAALMAGRDESLDHGVLSTYRHGRCRCPECRRVHEEARDAEPVRAAVWVRSARRRRG